MSDSYKLPLILLGLFFFCFGMMNEIKAQNGWINEIHYQGADPDQTPFLEIALEDVGQFSPEDWMVYLYSSSTGSQINGYPLSSFILGASSGAFSFYHLDVAAMPSDRAGIALGYKEEILQFISYGGEFTATGGILAGRSSTDIAVLEEDSPQTTQSLQLSGSGYSAHHFSWAGPLPSTKGSPNSDQSFLATNLSSTLINQSSEEVESAAVAPFGVMAFDLQDAGEDGVGTSLTRLAFTVAINSIGLADQDGLRLQDVLTNFSIIPSGAGLEQAPEKMEFPDHQTVWLYFPDGAVTVPDGANELFTVKAAISPTFAVEDHASFSLRTRVQDFHTGPNSSRIAVSQTDLPGSVVKINIQATALKFEEVPSLVIGERQDYIEDEGEVNGEEFSVTIKAVDANGRWDIDFEDNLTLDILDKAHGKSLNNDVEGTTPPMDGGIATSSGLIYSSTTLPETFILTVTGNKFSNEIFESTEIQASALQDKSSVVTIVPGSGYPNIPYADFQAVSELTSENSLILGSFTFEDAKATGAENSDGLATFLKGLQVQVSNPENLRTLAVFNGAVRLAVQSVEQFENSIVTFEGLEVTIPDNSSINLDVRATFKETVTDNAKISVSIYKLLAGSAGSRFANEMPENITIGGNESDDVNRLEVKATELRFISVPANAEVEQPFAISIEAIDELGNRDLDESSPIKITKGSGPGALTPDPLVMSLHEGFLERADLQVDLLGYYSIKVDDEANTFSATTSVTFQVFKSYNYEGVLISEIAHGTNSGTPRYIEITNTSTSENSDPFETIGLENISIRVYENGATTPSQVLKLPFGVEFGPGASYVIGSSAFDPSWGDPFTNSNPDLVNSAIVGNGNDVYELYDHYNGVVLDVFGEKGVDGTGKDWAYTQKLVNRKSGIGEGNGGAFSMSEFTIVPYANTLANPGTSTTADLTGPVLESAVPAVLAQDVLENSSFSFQFSEALNFESGMFHIKRKDDLSTIFSVELSDASKVNGEGTNTINIQPGIILPGLTELVAEFDAGTLTDLAGNSITGFAYEFKTTDTIHPAVLALEPADNGNKAPLNPIFRITFSEAVIPAFGFFQILDKEEEILVGFVDIQSEDVRQPQPNIIEFELANKLERLKDYYVTASEGIVVDTGGNPFAGFTAQDSWNFKTVDPFANSPKWVKLNPQKQEQHVILTHKPAITFDEPVQAGRGMVQLFDYTTEALIKTIQVESGEGFTISKEEVSFDFGDLTYGTTYYILMEEGSFTDPENNPIEGFAGKSDWTFSTLENNKPLIVLEKSADPLYFGNVAANTESTTKTYRLGGRNLSQNVVLEVPAPYLVSLDGGSSYQPGSISLTPGQLQGYRNVVVKFAPKEANGQLYQAELLHQSAETATVALGLLGREGAGLETISIAEARALGAGSLVEISGTVTSGSSFGGLQRYLQDATGAILIHSSNPATLSGIKRGDRVKVNGTLALSNSGHLQIGGENLEVEVQEEESLLPEPKQVYAHEMGELLESQLLQLRNIQFEKAGEQFRANQYYLFTDTKGGRGRVKIEGSGNPLANTIIPSVATLKGLLLQENTYSILPRDLADVEVKEPAISLGYPDGKMNFGFVKAGEQSQKLRIIVTQQDLAEEVIISVPAPFKVSTNSVGFSQSVSLPAASGSASIWVQFLPQETNGAIYQQELSFSSSSAAEVRTTVAGVEGTKPDLFTMAEARVMRLGQKVKVKGIVSSGNTISNNLRYFQDATAGLVVSLEGDRAFTELEIGTEIQVEGHLTEQKGLLIIGNTPVWEIIDASAGVPEPILVDASGFTEGNEATLVAVQNLKIEQGGTFKAGKVYEFLFPSGEKGLLKIPEGDHPLAGMRIPYLANVTGVLSESAEGYMLIPRSIEDLQEADAVVNASFPNGEMKFLFVPAWGTSAVKSFKLNGERLQGNISLSTNAPFEISGNGVSFGRSATIERDNAADATIYVRYKPTLSGGAVSDDFVLVNTLNGRTLKVPLTGIEGDKPNLLTIAQARALGAGEEVTIQGVLTSGSGWYTGKRFVQDETGGLTLTASNSAFNGYEAGDKIEVKGILENPANHLQLKTGTITLKQKAAGMPVARVVSSTEQLQENNESEWLSLSGIRFTSTGYFENNRVYLVLLENGEEALVRIRGDQNSIAGTLIPETANLKALLVQNGEVYELHPRNLNDLEVISSPKALILLAAENGFDFGTVTPGTASYREQYQLTAQGISEPILVSVEAPFQLSSDGATWQQSLELAALSVKVPVYVRFNPAADDKQRVVSQILHTAEGVEVKLPVQGNAVEPQAVVVGPDFEENFNQCFGLNSFTTYDVNGSKQWNCAEGWGVSQSGAVGIHYLGGDPEANEDWLISPKIQITSGSRMAVDIARQHAGTELEILVSTNYKGSGNPSQASWEKLILSLPSSGNNLGAFESIRDINLSKFAGKDVHIAFRYQSTNGAASSYLLDNFSIQSLPSVGFKEQYVTLQEGSSSVIKLSLNAAAKQAGSVTLRLSPGAGLSYGEQGDFTTSPALNSTGELVLAVEAGQQEISFSIHAREDLLEEGDEQLNIQLMATSTGLIIHQGANQMSLVIKSNNATIMSLVEARKVNEQGDLVNKEKLVKLIGVAYGPNLSLQSNGLEFRLIDHSTETATGITVALQNATSISYRLKEGDELEVTGVLRNQEGLAILEPQVVKVRKQGVTLKEARKVSALDENTESKLILLEQVEVFSGWQTNPTADFNVQVKDDAGNQFTVQIRPGTDLYGTEKPKGKISLVGFGAQKDASQPYTQGYYLLPRSKADVKIPTGLGQEQVTVLLTLFPNPAHSQFYIRSTESHLFESVQVIGYNGQILLNEAFEEGKAFNTQKLANGMYLVKIILKGGNYTIGRLSVIR